MWLIAQSLGSKVANLLTHFILAWLLSKTDFGLIALAYTVAAFASLTQQAGHREILVQRQAHFHRWANAAFWMSLAMACMGTALMVVSAPVAAFMFHEPRVIGLILILGLATPLEAMAIVPTARLQSQLQFRTLSMIGITSAFLTLALTLIAASPMLNLGAYAFVAPRPIVALLSLVAYWRAASVRVLWNPQFKRWKHMFADSGVMWGIAVMNMILLYGDNLTLGLLCSTAVLGSYYFAYNLSFQTTQMVVSNLQSALFPALSRLADDPPRQTQAFFRASRISGAVGVYLCLLQAAVAAPVIEIVFGNKWQEAIPLVQLLSIAIACNTACGPTLSLMQAQGRFRFLFYYQILTATLFLGAVMIGALVGQATGVAVSLIVLNLVSTPVTTYVATRPGGGRAHTVFWLVVTPLALGTIAILPVFLFATWWRSWGIYSNALRILMVLGVSGPLYAVLVRHTMPDVWLEVSSRIRLLRGRARPAAAHG
jgi:PST family polysaccharide transporter